MQPAPRGAEFALALVGDIERKGLGAVAGDVLDRPKGEDGAEAIGRLRGQKGECAAGAVAAQVDASGIDELCLARKSAAASTSSTSPKKPSWKPGLSLPPRKDGYIMTMPALRKALAD
jgi:hypothetical protein